MFSTHLLRPSVSWRNAGLYWGMSKRAQLAAYALQGWNKPWAPIWNMEILKNT